MKKQIHTGDTLKSTKNGLRFLIAGYNNGAWDGYTDNGVHMRIKQKDEHYEHVPSKERVMTIPTQTWVLSQEDKYDLRDRIYTLEKEKAALIKLYTISQGVVTTQEKELKASRLITDFLPDIDVAWLTKKVAAIESGELMTKYDWKLSEAERGQH